MYYLVLVGRHYSEGGSKDSIAFTLAIVITISCFRCSLSYGDTVLNILLQL